MHPPFGLLVAALLVWPSASRAMQIDVPQVGLAAVPVTVVVSDVAPGTMVSLDFGNARFSATADSDGIAGFTDLVPAAAGVVSLRATAEGDSFTSQLRVLPGWVSLLPALLAIATALLLRNVVPALVLGLWVGAAAVQGFTPQGIWLGLLDVFATYIVGSLEDSDRIAIIMFTMMIGGMVGIITRNGGMASIVRVVVSRAKSAVSGQVAVWLMGLMIFFDDYANTLVVGNTARPVTDHLRISREKLAYIVDSTAAPVVCVALVTTWIGYQVSLIEQAKDTIPGLATTTAYSIFLNSIPYSFYPILAVVFVLIVSLTGRDIGPMYAAEVRARQGQVETRKAEPLPAMDADALDPKPDVPMRPVNAFLPIITLIVSLAAGMYVTGHGETITDIVGSADPYKAMMWASFMGALVAAGLSMGGRILSAHETVDAWYGGARATLFGMIVLVLAWSMADVTGVLNARGYLITVLGESLPVAFVPAAVFLLAAVTAFSTGTSWGTMGILVPLVVPLAWAIMAVNGIADASGMHVLYSAVACVLAGAVWGDHCSPISDTTVLSSLASGCDHIEHVRTQLPYALIVGAVAVGVGTVPCGFGFSPWLSMLVSIPVLVAILRFFGRNAGEPVE